MLYNYRRKSRDKHHPPSPQVNGDLHIRHDTEEVYSAVNHSTRARKPESQLKTENNNLTSEDANPVIPPKTELSYIVSDVPSSAPSVEARTDNSIYRPQRNSVLSQNRDSDPHATVSSSEESVADESVRDNSNENIQSQIRNTSDKRKHVVTISIDNDNPSFNRKDSTLIHNIDGKMLRSSKYGEQSTENPYYESSDLDTNTQQRVNFVSAAPSEIPAYDEIRLSHFCECDNEEESTENPFYVSYDLFQKKDEVHKELRGILKSRNTVHST